MNKRNLNILLVSSKPPEYSAHLGGDIVRALQKKGCTVDYLSLYPSKLDNTFKIYNILNDEPKSKSTILRNKLSPFFFNCVKKTFTLFRNLLNKALIVISDKRRIEINCRKSGFYYIKEEYPDIKIDTILNKIPQNNQYDLIISLFWENMLNSTTLKALYDKFKVPIYIYSVDMAPITGGCYYFNNCDRYKYECGKCPCLLSKNLDDRSHQNFIIKKNNYSKSKIYYLGNSWMLERAIASKLFDSRTVLNMNIIIDETIFCPKDSSQIRQKFNISPQYDIVLLIRSSNANRKGGNILEYSVKKLWQDLSDKDRKRICLVFIGDHTLQNKFTNSKIPFFNLGFVDRDSLIDLYRESTFFLNPSIDDAGPSMVNQSIMCGTPVVSFNIGTAVDVIENGISGFKTDDISKEGFSQILKIAVDSIINQTYPEIQKTTRGIALKFNTSSVFADKLLTHYYNSITLC